MAKFPKPWRLVQTDPGCIFAVEDADGRKLFFVCEDENPDGEDLPGGPDGPTILGYGNDADTEALLLEIEEMFGRNNLLA